MSDQAVATRPETEGISATLQERVREFTAFYEQHAYLAYNLALRVACADEPARKAVHRAFLAQLEDRPHGLISATAVAALEEENSRVDPAAAGDAEAQVLMAASAELAPAERAAMALADLAEADPEAIGEALGVPGEHASRLLHRARESFAARLGLPRTQADEAARDWMWAAPPNEIWEALYPEFHRTVERRLRRGSTEQTLILAPAAGDPSARPAVRRGRPRGRWARPRWARRPRWRYLLPAAALLAAGGVAAAQLLSSGDSSQPAPPKPPVYAPFSGDQPATPGAADDGDDVKPRKPLTAALLDKLRLRELRQLRAYAKRQADSSLPARQRRAAAQRIAAIERAARARLRAQRRREAILRDREARERAARQAPPPPPATPAPRRQTPQQETTKPKTQNSAPAGPPASREEAEKTCLRDEDTGQYICPQ